VVHSRNDISFLVLRTPNQEFIVIRITSGPYLVDKFVETSSADGLANVKERRFADFSTDPNLECYQT
jgi:hypothetical protein